MSRSPIIQKKRRKKYIYIPKSYRKLTKDEMEIFNKKEPEKKEDVTTD